MFQQILASPYRLFIMVVAMIVTAHGVWWLLLPVEFYQVFVYQYPQSRAEALNNGITYGVLFIGIGLLLLLLSTMSQAVRLGLMLLTGVSMGVSWFIFAFICVVNEKTDTLMAYGVFSLLCLFFALLMYGYLSVRENKISFRPMSAALRIADIVVVLLMFFILNFQSLLTFGTYLLADFDDGVRGVITESQLVYKEGYKRKRGFDTYLVKYSYNYNDTDYESSIVRFDFVSNHVESTLERYPVGKEVFVFIDSDSPRLAVLEKDYLNQNLVDWYIKSLSWVLGVVLCFSIGILFADDEGFFMENGFRFLFVLLGLACFTLYDAGIIT